MQAVSQEVVDYAEDLVPEGTFDFKLKKLIEGELVRRLSGYRHTVRMLEKKYGMDFDTFKDRRMVEKRKYSFEVESDFCDWEMGLDGIRSMEKRLSKLRKDLDEYRGG